MAETTKVGAITHRQADEHFMQRLSFVVLRRTLPVAGRPKLALSPESPLR